MARLVGVDLPRNKRIEIALTYIYGIGLTTAKEIIAATGVDPDIRVKDLSEEDLAKLRDYIQQNLKVEGDLPDGDRLLSRSASSSRPARSRPAHAHECPYPQGSAQANRRQEEVVR